MDLLLFFPIASLILAHVFVMLQYGRINFSLSGQRNVLTTRRRWLMVTQIALWAMCLTCSMASLVSAHSLSRQFMNMDYDLRLAGALLVPVGFVVAAMLFRGKIVRLGEVVVSCVQLLLLLPAGYGLLLCASAFAGLNRNGSLLRTLSQLVAVREFLDGFLLMVGVTLAVATIQFSAWTRFMSIRYMHKIKRPFQPENVLSFGTWMTIILIAVAVPAYIEFYQTGSTLRANAIRGLLNLKDWADTYKSVSDVGGLNPTSFFTGGTFAILAPVLTGIIANALPKSKHENVPTAGE